MKPLYIINNLPEVDFSFHEDDHEVSFLFQLYKSYRLYRSAGLYVHILIKLAVLAGTPCCVTQPSIIFFRTFLFRNTFILFFHFISFFLWILGFSIVAATDRFFIWSWSCLKFGFAYTFLIATSTWHYYSLEIKLILRY